MIEDGEELQLCHLPSHLKRTKIIHNRYQTTSTNNDLLNNIQATTLAAALREVEKKLYLILYKTTTGTFLVLQKQ